MQTVNRLNTKSTTQKVRSISHSGLLGSNLASISVAFCRHCCRSLVPVSSMQCSGLACCCHCCCYLVSVLPMSFSGLRWCCHCCRSLFPILLMSCSGLVLVCVNFPCYHVANSYTVSSLSRQCLVLILLLSDSFIFRSLQETLSVLQSCGKYFCTKCTLTLRMCHLRKVEFKKYKLSLSIKTYVGPYLV